MSAGTLLNVRLNEFGPKNVYPLLPILSPGCSFEHSHGIGAGECYSRLIPQLLFSPGVRIFEWESKHTSPVPVINPQSLVVPGQRWHHIAES